MPKDFAELEKAVQACANTQAGNDELRRRLTALAEQWKKPAWPDNIKRVPMTAAEQHYFRYYRQDHFSDQTGAERAYFRVLVESLERGRIMARLSAKLGKARTRTRQLIESNRLLRQELAIARARFLAVDPVEGSDHGPSTRV